MLSIERNRVITCGACRVSFDLDCDDLPCDSIHCPHCGGFPCVFDFDCWGCSRRAKQEDVAFCPICGGLLCEACLRAIAFLEDLVEEEVFGPCCPESAAASSQEAEPCTVLSDEALHPLEVA